MKLNEIVKDLDGKPLLENSEEVTLSAVLLRSLLTPMRGDENMAGQEKVKLAVLAMKINGKDEADFTAEETTLMKDRIGRAFAPIVVLRAWQALDPASISL